MKRLSLRYVARRFIVFLLTIWLSATIVFIVPRLAPGDPIGAMLGEIQQMSGFVEGSDEMIADWRARFGLDEPVYVQYVRFLISTVTFDFGPSLSAFPTPVSVIVGRSLPWTIGLLVTAVLIAFVLGSAIGALLAWQRSPRFLRTMLPFSMMFTSLPPVLAAIFLLYLFGFTLDWFPFMGAYARGLEPALSLEFIGSVLYHGTLPALSIILVSFGAWALNMRGMLVTLEGEDYVILAQAFGLRQVFILYRYMVRNAMLPQLTQLALAIGQLMGGAVLVEVIFNYPGMGTTILQAIQRQDFALIQGSTMYLIFTTAFAVFLIDLLYPFIDPRVTYENK